MAGRDARAQRLPQDEDDSVPEDEAERRLNRFVELVDAVQGNEPDEVFVTLIETLKDQEDYGAYESACTLRWPASTPSAEGG